MTEPVIRTQFRGPEEPAPITGMSGAFGVARYQIGASDESTSPQQPSEQPATRGPSATFGSNVLRATTRGDVTTYENTSDVQRSNSGALNSPKADAPFFHSSGGRALMPTEIRGDSLVTINGVGTTNVRAAIAAGFIQQNEHGVYVSASGAPAVAPGETPEKAPEEAPEAVPQVEPLDDQSEAIMTQVVSRVGNLDAASLVSSLVDTGSIPDAIAQRVATSMGITPDQVRENASTVTRAFEDQARKAVGSGFDEVVQYARQHHPRELREAMLTHANQGTTEQYKALASRYMESLADTEAGRAVIMSSADVEARGVRVDREGRVTINVPNVGRVPWRVAVRQGFIKPAHKR